MNFLQICIIVACLAQAGNAVWVGGKAAGKIKVIFRSTHYADEIEVRKWLDSLDCAAPDSVKGRESCHQ